MYDNLDSLFSSIEADKLPSLPHVLLVLLDASHTEVVSFDQLSDLIKKDAALAARVVSAASTAYYGGQGKNLTFERTLVLLGLDTIKTIAITASVQQFFSRFDSARSRKLKQFWRDSLSCAVIAKSIAKLTGYAYLDEAYLAGLMHNIGELIFVNHFHEEYFALIESAQDAQQRSQLERDQFGGDRYEAGAWLIGGWQTETFIADAVLYQTEAVEQLVDAHHLVKVLYLANLLCAQNEAEQASALSVAERLFDLDQSLVLDVVAEAAAEVAEAARAMDIDIEDEDTASPDEAFSQDELKQVELAARVRNVALMDGVRRQITRTTDEGSALQAIKQGLNILFGAKHSYFFFLDAAGEKLVGQAASESEASISQFSTAVDSGASLLARCYQQRQPISSFEPPENMPVSVMDRQIIKLTSSEGILCFPLMVENSPLGVLVVGVGQAAHERYAEQLELLSMFAAEAAQQIKGLQQASETKRLKNEEEREYYHARAREIVHEVNNPLSIINNYVHILSTKLDQAHAAQGDLSIIREELERAGNILLRLPGIAERKTTETGDELVDINRVIADLLKVFRSSLFVTHRIESTEDFDPGLEPIVVDPNALKQIVTNIVKNAAEALPESGRIKVSTQRLVNQGGKNYVEIVIEDNGSGIPDAIKAKLFSPVESTKGGGHSGLGLTIVKNLLDKMGGLISCRSSAKSGTRFEIWVPRANDDE